MTHRSLITVYPQPTQKVKTFLKNFIQTATISNIIPLNKANRDNILASYGSSDAEIMYSDRNDKYSYNALVSKPDMEITTVDTSKVYNRADTVFEAKKNAAKIGTVHEDGSVSIHVKDIDADVLIGRKELEHGLDRRLEQLSPITVKAGKILSNSIRINELTPKEKEASNSYILIGVAKDQINNTFIVEFVVNRYTNELKSIDVLHSINSNKKSTAVLNAPPVSTPDYRTKISISDLLDYVNRYFPDVSSEDVCLFARFPKKAEAYPEGHTPASVNYRCKRRRSPRGSAFNKTTQRTPVSCRQTPPGRGTRCRADCPSCKRCGFFPAIRTGQHRCCWCPPPCG